MAFENRLLFGIRGGLISYLKAGGFLLQFGIAQFIQQPGDGGD
jgi:hypothetical protein